MTRNDDEDRFRVRPAPPRARDRPPKSKFITSVVKRAAISGRPIGRRLTSTRSQGSTRQFGRGRLAARLATQALHSRSRRVTIQTHIVQLQKVHPRCMPEHIRYIARDVAARAGEPGHHFDATSDEADGDAFVDRTKDDRHNFRIMISPEEGTEIDDLKTFTRDLMRQVEQDLDTPLDWIAAENWDTDQPHVHIVLRGKDAHGQDLVIAPDYITEGMRARASAVATEWLGPRTDLEIRASLTREVIQERWTPLDRTLADQARDGVIVIQRDTQTPEDRFRVGLQIGRLEHLVKLGVATRLEPLTYRLADNAESVLRTLGERGDIVRTMQRALGRERRELVIGADLDRPVVGRIAGKGLIDEMHDRAYVVIDGIDGRAHYIKLPPQVALDQLTLGGIVEARSGDANRADANIARVSQDGLYRVDRHTQLARTELRADADPQAYVQSHVRRLEALRRARIVDRLEEGVWRIPANFLERAAAYDAARSEGATITLHSHLPVTQQARAIGATWLDRQLIGSSTALATQGFGAEARTALNERREFLITRGLAERRGSQIIVVRQLLNTLRRQELEEAGRRLSSETGLAHRPVSDGQSITGQYSRSLQLVSGRFAMLDDGVGFSLVPWRPVLEQRLGQSMTAVIRGNFSSFEFGRKRDLSL